MTPAEIENKVSELLEIALWHNWHTFYLSIDHDLLFLIGPEEEERNTPILYTFHSKQAIEGLTDTEWGKVVKSILDFLEVTKPCQKTIPL